MVNLLNILRVLYPDDKGQAELTADINGEGFVRIDGSYLVQVLKACGGMVDFSLTNALSPMLFTLDGYRVVVMPMVTDKAQKEAKATEPPTESVAKPEPITEPEVVTKAEAKPKRSR